MKHETDRDKILAGYSEEFRALHAEIGRRLKARFPDARPVQEWGMAAWQVKVPQPPPKEDWKGTMPNDVFTVGPTEKKAGITIHVWHPNEPYLLKENAGWLKEAGFKPMVGCLQWNRKADFPLDVFDDLLGKAEDAM